MLKYIFLRVTIITILVILSIVLKDDFSALSDFVGASCITVNSILLPIIYYFVKAWDKIPLYEKIPGIIFVVVCFVLGCYVTYTSGEELFSPSHSDVNFPFCSPEHEMEVYYNYTAIHG
jgi:vesicular inhibitory amino acid transporter